MATLRQGTYGDYYGSLFNQSEPLTFDEMCVNATYIYKYLASRGWTVNAICGMLGNMQAESTLNPGRWQSEDVGNTSMGYGLVQWTPATNYLNWCDQFFENPVYASMDSNLSRIIYEVENGLQWITKDAFPISFVEFTKSNNSVEYLAKAFLLNYERPKDQSTDVQNYRASLASSWYEYITNGDIPIPDEPNTPIQIKKKKKFKFLLLTARKRREQWIKQNF